MLGWVRDRHRAVDEVGPGGGGRSLAPRAPGMHRGGLNLGQVPFPSSSIRNIAASVRSSDGDGIVMTSGRVALLLFVTGALLFAFAAARLTGTSLFPGGDEPHYLIMAQSLWRDGELAIEDNHAREEYKEYYVTTDVLAPHYLTRGTDGEIYSVHPVGLPVVLAPVYALGGYTAVRLLLIMVSAAVGTRRDGHGRRAHGRRAHRLAAECQPCAGSPAANWASGPVRRGPASYRARLRPPACRRRVHGPVARELGARASGDRSARRRDAALWSTPDTAAWAIRCRGRIARDAGPTCRGRAGGTSRTHRLPVRAVKPLARAARDVGDELRAGCRRRVYRVPGSARAGARAADAHRAGAHRGRCLPAPAYPAGSGDVSDRHHVFLLLRPQRLV